MDQSTKQMCKRLIYGRTKGCVESRSTQLKTLTNQKCYGGSADRRVGETDGLSNVPRVRGLNRFSAPQNGIMMNRAGVH